MKRVFIMVLIFTIAVLIISRFTKIEKKVSKQKNNFIQKTWRDPQIPVKLIDDFKIGLYADNLGVARDLEFTPDGILLVSDLSGRVLALPDNNNDGVADEVKVLLQDLNRPHGLAFFNNYLYIAEETQIVRYSWNKMELSNKELILKLPQGDRHYTRTIAFDKSGIMYVSIGSRCNACIEDHQWIGTVITATSEGENPKVFATGLRNAVFIAFHPETSELWSTEMGRDFLGNDLPPDEINILKEGQDYGWPHCYGNNIIDTDFNPEAQSEICNTSVIPAYNTPAHSAPLGLTFINSKFFPEDWQGDLLVAYHGSWHSTVPVGYKVTRLNVEESMVKNETDFISGFIKGEDIFVRPVDLIFDKEGYLYLSSDKRGVVYIIGK